MEPRKKQHITTGGAGYIPTFTAENAEHTLKTIVNNYLFGNLPIDTIRQRLYDNITPIGYNDVIKRVKSAVKDNKREDIKGMLDSSFEFDEQGYNMQRDALWAQYLQIPENKRHRLYDLYNKSARLKKAEYQPSIGKKSNMFYSLTLPGYIKDKVVEEGIGLNYNDRKGIAARNLETFLPSALGNYLGDYTVSKGHDDKGSYISYYDMWDLDPSGRNKGDASMSIGKPIPIYDRIYLDDYYGVDSSARPGTYYGGYLPEVIIKPKRNDKK